VQRVPDLRPSVQEVSMSRLQGGVVLGLEDDAGQREPVTPHSRRCRILVAMQPANDNAPHHARPAPPIWIIGVVGEAGRGDDHRPGLAAGAPALPAAGGRLTPTPQPDRFPRPWRVRHNEDAYWVEDAAGHRFGFTYYRDTPLVGTDGGERLSRDAARRIVSNIARLPELLGRR
jgi:hypothetical protein